MDVGEKRIGIAISDPLGWTAQGHSVLTRQSLQKDFEALMSICRDYEVKKLVIGFPRNMNGTIGPKASEIKAFADALQKYSGMEIEFWDERLSTQAAAKTLLEADVSRRKRKKVIDKLAAVNILQGYLDRHRKS